MTGLPRRAMMVAMGGFSGLFLTAAAGCGGSVEPSTSSPLATTANTALTTTAPVTAAPVTAAPVTAAPVTAAPIAAPAQKATVPNVVGGDHQLAQDMLQAAGFYGLAEEDASGLKRMLVLDRNWKVCAQSVAGGTQAATDTTIVLSSVKDEERCP